MVLVEPFSPTVLRHPSSTLELHVLPYGLTTHRLLLHAETTVPDAAADEQGSADDAAAAPEAVQGAPPKVALHDLLVGPEEPEDHWTYGRAFFGPVVGRYANRLPVGETKFDDKGEERCISWPEWGGEGISHHGGPATGPYRPGAECPRGEIDLSDSPQAGPFDVLIWQLVSPAEAQLFNDSTSRAPSSSSAIFVLNSAPNADGSGAPSIVRIEARISILPPSAKAPIEDLGRSAGAVRMEYRARVVESKDEAPTPLNLTQHWAFNLSASSPTAREAEKGTIDDHTLRFLPDQGKSVQTFALDERSIPTGELLPADGPHDFTPAGSDGFGRSIGSNAPKGGHDHFYAWGKSADMPVRAILRSPSTGLAVTFKTNQSGTQLYTANGQPDAPAASDKSGGARKFLHGGDAGENDGNVKRSGAFFEFAHPHATFLHAKYRELAGTDTLVRLGDAEVYSNVVEAEVWES